MTNDLQITVVFSNWAAAALNNAIRREIEVVESRHRCFGSLDADSELYLRQLDECREAVALAFERVTK
jgi:hypothetical protein